MSIEKNIQKKPYFKLLNNENNPLNYRVRQLSRNQSLKQLPLKDPSRKHIFIKSDKNIPSDTSFFIQQSNIQNIHIKQQKDLPKFIIDVNKQKLSTIRKNTSHRVLRKIQSHQLLPQTNQIKIINPTIKQPTKNVQRQFSLKKKVSLIKKGHNFAEKSTYFSTPSTIDIKSENFLIERKKSKPKLKLLVRDPFKSHIQQKYKNESFSESRIQNDGRKSFMSDSNRKDFQYFINCIN